MMPIPVATKSLALRGGILPAALMTIAGLIDRTSRTRFARRSGANFSSWIPAQPARAAGMDVAAVEAIAKAIGEYKRRNRPAEELLAAPGVPAQHGAGRTMEGHEKRAAKLKTYDTVSAARAGIGQYLVFYNAPTASGPRRVHARSGLLQLAAARGGRRLTDGLPTAPVGSSSHATPARCLGQPLQHGFRNASLGRGWPAPFGSRPSRARGLKHDDGAVLLAWLIEAAVRYAGKPVSVPGLQSLPVLYPFRLTRPLAYVASTISHLGIRAEGTLGKVITMRRAK